MGVGVGRRETGAVTVGKNIFLGVGKCLGHIFCIFIAGQGDKLVNDDLL